MTEIIRASGATILTVESSGDGTFASAVQVDLPTAHTILLVEMPISGHQGIKLPEGNLNDVAEIFVLSGVTGGANPRLHIFDADGNRLAQTDNVGALNANESIVARKILPSAYSIPPSYDGAFLGTWLCHAQAVRSNYSPST